MSESQRDSTERGDSPGGRRFSLSGYLRGVQAALVFLTRIPGGSVPADHAAWRYAAAHFPLIGAFIGAAEGALLAALAPHLGALVAGGLVVAFHMLLTGGFHEDGFADTCDGLGGGFDREDVLRILKDSRVGAYGAMGVAVIALLRVALLDRLVAAVDTASLLGEAHRVPLLVVSMAFVGAASRATAVLQLAALPYARRDDPSAKSRDAAQGGAIVGLTAAGWACLAAAFALHFDVAAWRIGLALGFAAAVLVVSGWRYMRRVGGVTGDFLGATQQMAVVALLAALTWARA